MINVRLMVMMFLLCVTLFSTAAPPQKNETYSRSFWYPLYCGKRLDYCMNGGSVCGFEVANQYCKLMGYEKSDRSIVDYNVSQTKPLLTGKICKGMSCNGFLLIRCQSTLTHQPAKPYYYRERAFDFPRVGADRIDWCYADEKGCGQRAAYSFCRRMGYRRASEFEKQEHVAITRSLGNQKRCFGKACSGFRKIVCYR